jgi:hypothetical protein
LPIAGRASDGASVAGAIATAAARILRDPRRLVPLRHDRRVLWVLPKWHDPGSWDDPLRGEDLGLLRTAGGGAANPARTVSYATEPGAADFARVATTAAEADVEVVIVAVLRARFSAALRDLMRQCLEWHPSVIYLMLGERDDEVALTDRARGAAVVCVYGFRPVHQMAALALLFQVSAPPSAAASPPP